MLLEIELFKKKKREKDKEKKQEKQNCIKSGLTQFLFLPEKI